MSEFTFIATVVLFICAIGFIVAAAIIESNAGVFRLTDNGITKVILFVLAGCIIVGIGLGESIYWYYPY